MYALLLGSGVSTGAGVPTGWGVVTELARRAAAAAGAVPDGDFEAEAWWAEHGGDGPLGYSALLEALAKTPAARRALLAAFFEPTEEDRKDGRKVPGAAHKAVAELVRRGTVRVIVTTNFDRLLEQALEAVGIMPQVVATPSAVAGMEPLAHARCTVIKLHGDYASLDQLNTLEELTTYSPEMSGLLDRVLDEYGLVVSGWSADWDHALVAALEGTRSRRYPLYWASYRDLGAAASRLVAQHRAPVITGVAADRFFPDVVSRLEALDSLSSAPLSVAMSIAQLKRALPDPVKHIQVSDLFDEHVAPIRDLLGGRAAFATSMEPQAVEEEHEVLVRSANTLLQLVAHGVYLDRDEQHTSLWVHVIQKLMRARRAPSGAHHQWVDALAHLPALLVLRAAVIAAIEAGHERAVVRMLNEPSWRDPFGSGGHAPAAVVLHDYRVLDHDIINTFPRWNGTRWLYAQSRYIKDTRTPDVASLFMKGRAGL